MCVLDPNYSPSGRWETPVLSLTGERRLMTFCINDFRYKGPDRNNSLQGVLLWFPRHLYVVTADIENIFHRFAITEDKRTYTRFFWSRNNDPRKHIIEYYSQVHLMGLLASPAITNGVILHTAITEPPKDGQTWIEKVDVLDTYQRNRTRIPDEVQKS